MVNLAMWSAASVVARPPFVRLGNFPDVEEEREHVGSRVGVVVAGESKDPGPVAEIDSDLRGDAHLFEATVELGEVAVQVVGGCVRHPKSRASDTARSCSLVVLV